MAERFKRVHRGPRMMDLPGIHDKVMKIVAGEWKPDVDQLGKGYAM